MKFSEVVSNIARVTDLRRIAKARLFDVSSLPEEELKEQLIEKVDQFASKQALESALNAALDHPDHSIRLITPVVLIEILLQKHDYSLPENETAEEVMAWEQSVIDESKEQETSARMVENYGTFEFVVQAAWENDDSISQDEHRLIERIRNRFKITRREYRVLEAGLGRYPKKGNELHTRDDIKLTRHYLQEAGLLLTFRDSDGRDCDIIPEEMAIHLRGVLQLPLRHYGYYQLLGYRAVKQKSFLSQALESAGMVVKKNPSSNDLREICVGHINPEILLGGYSQRDGLDKVVLEKWCRDLQLQVSGSKSEVISRIIQYYDSLVEIEGDREDEREIWFQHYEEYACRDYQFLRQRQLIEKDLEVEHHFEAATDFLFEKYLNHKPLTLPGSEQPDGALSHGEKRLLWDNKSKEKVCNLKDHLGQFSRYFNKYAGNASALLVIAPDFTPDSANQALLHEVNTGQKLSLITAKELKDLTTRWSESKKKDEPFPLRFLTSVGRFNPVVAEAAFQ
jgi:hypothetical protein